MEFIKILAVVIVFGGILYAVYEVVTHKNNSTLNTKQFKCIKYLTLFTLKAKMYKILYILGYLK